LPSFEFGPRSLFHHQYWTMRKLDHAIRATPDHPLVKGRMAGGADDQQVSLDVGREFDDIADRVPGQEVGVKLKVCPFGHLLRALKIPRKRLAPRPVSSLISSTNSGR